MKKHEIINVKMDGNNSILNYTDSCEEATKTVLNHLLQTRPIKSPVWKPYVFQEAISYSKVRKHDVFFDMKRIYPEAKKYDAVYAAGNIIVEKDYEVWINVIGNVAVWLNGKYLFSSYEKAKEACESKKYISLPVYLKKDEKNLLVIKNVYDGETPGFWLNISPPNCASLWANFYLVMARVHLPIENLEKEEGLAVSPLYSGFDSMQEAYNTACDFEKNPVYNYPKIIAESNKVNFCDMYKEGEYAFSYSFADNNAKIVLYADSQLEIFLNNTAFCTLQKGEEKVLLIERKSHILLRSKKEGDSWGYEIKECKDIGLSMLDTDRKEDFKFLYCGPFYTNKNISFEGDLKKLLTNEKGETVFWKFQNADLRAYMDSSFFGQWYYATMLCCYGMQYAGNVVGEKKFSEYFLENMNFLADWYNYARYDFKKYNFANFMIGASTDDMLDFIGTMGVNFIEAYNITGDEKFFEIIEKLYNNIKTKVSRFFDATFCRAGSGTMWADDFFMSCPFLVRLYKDFSKKDCLDEIILQIKGFKKRLYMPEKKIFSHIYFINTKEKNSIPWGRGNGWIALALSEVLLKINDERNEEFATLQAAFSEFCEGLSSFQDEEGMWHQVLDNEKSYQEASCTAMFALALYRGVKNNWIEEKYMHNVIRAVNALLKKCVDKDGVFYNVCMGSSCSMDVSYYMRLGTVKDDNHGTGVLLMLLGDIIKYGDSKVFCD